MRGSVAMRDEERSEMLDVVQRLRTVGGDAAPQSDSEDGESWDARGR